MARVFISYAREDQQMAFRLYHDLRQGGHEPWIDKYNIRPGEIWRPAIQRALRESSHALFLLSRCSVNQRGFFQAELKEALEVLREVPERTPFLIPARLEECEFPAFALREIHYIDLFPDYSAAVHAILAALSGNPLADDGGDPELRTAVHLFHQGCFEEAAHRFSALVKRDPRRGEPRYYLVLSFLAGKRPRLLSGETVGKLEEHLRMALASEWAPQFRFLLALIKYDYYVLNGLREPSPTIDDLTRGGLQIAPEHAVELRATLSAPGNPLWDEFARGAM